MEECPDVYYSIVEYTLVAQILHQALRDQAEVALNFQLPVGCEWAGEEVIHYSQHIWQYKVDFLYFRRIIICIKDIIVFVLVIKDQ